MKKGALYFFLINFLIMFSCNGQSENSRSGLNLKNYPYEKELLPEDKMIATTEEAIELIQNKKYKEIKDLLVDEISKNITENQIIQLVDQLNFLFQNEGIPTGHDNVVPAIQASMNGRDTIFYNTIMYNFEPLQNEPNSKILTFSFLKKYGSKQLIGIHLGTDGQKNAKPTINKLTDFNFNVNDISQFRIYYDEGKYKKTKYKNEIGYFAIEGDLSTLNEAGLTPIIQSVFEDLKKSKFEKVEIFNTTLNRGQSPSFIQIEMMLKDRPYLVFIYLPIEDDGTYSDKIILMQKELANLGYKYILNQKDYKLISNEFPEIANLNLEDFYHDNP